LRTSSSVFLTIHDVGSSYNSWVNFISHEDMKEVKDRSLFLHVCMPGQQAEEEDLSPDYMFPSMQMLGMNLVTVLDQLQINRVMVLGDGAGANMASRFAMCHPSRVHGVVLINCNPEKGGSAILNMFKGGRKDSKGEEMHKLNMKNVAKYEKSYRKRDEIISILATKMKTETLLLTGAKSRNIKGSEDVHRQIRTGICSIIRLEDVDNVLEEAEEKAADVIILFCQGVGLVPTVQRKISRKMSNTTKEISEEGDDTKLNMTRYAYR
jgi:protein NDRG1